MQIMFKLAMTTLGICLSLMACAEDKKNTTQKENKSKPINVSWENKSYKDWDSILHFSDKCPAKFDGNKDRFINIRPLNQEASLLAVSCELGAYQDGKLLYVLQAKGITSLEPTLPKFEDTWGLIKENIAWGNRYVEDDHLVLENWYSGSGECGYRAYYPISAVITQKSPIPDKVFGDVNCEDGIYLDDWPQILDLN